MATRKALVLVSGLFQELNSSSDKLDFAGNSTTDLSEGSNQYFTNARARGAVSVTDSGGDGSLAYNSSTGVITYTGPSASEARAHFSVASGITATFSKNNNHVTSNDHQLYQYNMDVTSSDYLGHDASNLVSAVGLDGKPVKETTFKVTSTSSPDKYYIDGMLAPSLTLERGKTYRFDLGDSTNSTHPFRISTTKDGTHGGGTTYTRDNYVTREAGRTYDTNMGPNTILELIIDSETPDTLYYYCTVHPNMANDAVINIVDAGQGGSTYN